jgi:hypothetical protein
VCVRWTHYTRLGNAYKEISKQVMHDTHFYSRTYSALLTLARLYGSSKPRSLHRQESPVSCRGAWVFLFVQSSVQRRPFIR